MKETDMLHSMKMHFIIRWADAIICASLFSPKPSLKIRKANTIFRIYFGKFRDYGLENTFFRNIAFFILKIES